MSEKVFMAMTGGALFTVCVFFCIFRGMTAGLEAGLIQAGTFVVCVLIGIGFGLASRR